MNRIKTMVVLCAAALTHSGLAGPVGIVQSDDLREKSGWVKEHLLDHQATQPPFSFTYGGEVSGKLLTHWPKKAEHHRLDRNRTRHTLTWIEAKSGLEVRCVAVDYADYPAVEWTVYFKNSGSNNSPILDNIRGLDTAFQRSAKGEFALHGINGDWCAADSFAPYSVELGPNATRRCAPELGKSTGGRLGWPYYNIQMPGGGVLLAVGWPGQWSTCFTRDQGTKLRVTAGQETTHLYLKPGEEIRAPLIALVFWKGADTVRAQNVWRRWYMAHVIPRVNGQPIAPIAQIQSAGNGRASIADAQSYLDAGIKIDICWTDAGWYTGGSSSWLNTGEWEPDPARYPQGFKPWSDWVRAQGMKFLLWFEPERIGNPDCWLARNRPAWLLANTGQGNILHLGDPAARKWLTDHVDGLIKTQGLDWYREDMNGSGPQMAWQKADAADRQGATENFYVQGHLAFWDALVQRNPGLLIDSCASGGRRNDLETMRRAVPLLRSDFQTREPGVIEGNQGHTYGLAMWLPYYGSGCYSTDNYWVRSFYLPGFGVVPPANWAKDDAQREVVRRAYAECRQVAPLMFGDYFPLTPYSLDRGQWIAWQFHRPEQDDGLLQAFRRDKCEEPASVWRLCGLNPAAHYEVTDFDLGHLGIRSGKELMETGLRVAIPGRPGAALIVYKRTK